MCILMSSICRANCDLDWADDMAVNSSKMVWENLKAQVGQQEQIGMGEAASHNEQQPRQFRGLYIFVSGSMPIQLLKAYFSEAAKYRGVLVFKGLPNGSFKELTALIVELTGEKEEQQGANIQIDDEAFERFGVSAVPTIVLAQMDEYVPNQELNLIYDKISGNVPIKYALERFAESGELKSKALESLNASW